MQLSKKQITFSQCFAPVMQYRSNFENSEKKMTLAADVFPKLRTPKDVTR